MKNSLCNTQNKLAKALFSAVILALVSTTTYADDAYGDPFEGWGFVKDDWQVVCDNTLTCRAAGYMDESMWDTPASILLTAVPKKLPIAYIFLPEAPLSSNDPIELWLNDKGFGKLLLDADGETHTLNAEQIQQLLRYAQMNNKIELRVGSQSWTISDKGMSAVLLKLDEVQGRVGTPLALVSKNNPNRQTPKSARPIPVIKKAKFYSEKQNKQLSAAKLAYFQSNIDKWVGIDSEKLMGSEEEMGDCELVNPNSAASKIWFDNDSGVSQWEFTPIDAKHTLASHICWRGAYNAASGYWLINDANPSKPELITTAGTEYYEGEIYAIHKDRGIGDCWNSKTWTWNSKTFALTEDSSTGMCRGFAGGAWNLPTYVSEVVNTND